MNIRKLTQTELWFRFPFPSQSTVSARFLEFPDQVPSGLLRKPDVLPFSCSWKEPPSASMSTVFSLGRRSLCFFFSDVSLDVIILSVVVTAPYILPLFLLDFLRDNSYFLPLKEGKTEKTTSSARTHRSRSRARTLSWRRCSNGPRWLRSLPAFDDILFFRATSPFGVLEC